MNLSVDHRFEGDLTIVEIRGEIDVFSSPTLREELLGLVENDRCHLVIDLAGVDFLDSTGLGVLVGIFHRLRNREGSMRFVGGTERVRRVFYVTQLDKIFDVHNDLDEARKAVAELG